MEDHSPNPYTPAAPVGDSTAGPAITLSAQSQRKLDSVLKDAGQFWLAMILCVVCTSIGILIILPWYGVRLTQWSHLAKQYPELMAPNAPAGSLPRQFQAARIKLLVGIVFGAVMLVLVIIGITLMYSLPADVGNR